MNFESFRVDLLRMTQNELAELLGVTQDKISRYEQGDPDDIPLGFYRKMAEKLDMTLYEILMHTGVKEVERAKVKELAVDYNSAWGKVDRTKKELIHFFEETINKDIIKNDPYSNVLKEQYKEMVCSCTRKKTIVVAGGFATGKTTLINSLLGSKFSSAIRSLSDTANEEIRLIRHSDERSSFMRNAVAVYLDCNILKNIDIIELPGYSSISHDSLENAINMISGADALIYLSSSINYLAEDEITYLQNAIKVLPSFECKGKNNISPLGNLFIVLSRADTYTYEEELDAIIDESIKRFSDSIPVDLKEYFSDRSKATGYDIEKKEFSERFFKYSAINPTMKESFEKNLKDFIYNISTVTLNDTNLFLTQFINFNTQEVDRDSFGKKTAEQLKKLDEAKAGITGAISEYSRKAEEEFDTTYASIIEERHIVQVIKNQNLKKRKADIKVLANFLSAELEISLFENLNHYSNLLQRNIEAYLADFNFPSLRGFDQLQMNAPFDVRLSFASEFSTFSLRFFGTSFLLPWISHPEKWLKAFYFISEIPIPNGGWQKEIANSIIAVYEKKEYNTTVIEGPSIIKEIRKVVNSCNGSIYRTTLSHSPLEIKTFQDSLNIKELIHEDIQDFWKQTSEIVDKAIDSMKNSLKENEESINQLSNDTQDLALTRKNLLTALSSGIKAIFSENQ